MRLAGGPPCLTASSRSVSSSRRLSVRRTMRSSLLEARPSAAARMHASVRSRPGDQARRAPAASSAPALGWQHTLNGSAGCPSLACGAWLVRPTAQSLAPARARSVWARAHASCSRTRLPDGSRRSGRDWATRQVRGGQHDRCCDRRMKLRSVPAMIQDRTRVLSVADQAAAGQPLSGDATCASAASRHARKATGKLATAPPC